MAGISWTDGSSPTQERLLARAVRNSPFRADPVTRPDTSQAVSCEICGARYLNVEYLAAHVADRHDRSKRRGRA